MEKTKRIILTDTIGGTVVVHRKGPQTWTVAQCGYGREHDNNHNPTSLKIFNPAAATRICINVKWAEPQWMGYRKFGYLQQGKHWQAITGRTGLTMTTYEFNAPSGNSIFAVTPWYSNEDAKQFVQRMAKKSPFCGADRIGSSAEGRDILRLTIGREGRPNIVIIGREHGNESASSFAVEAVADCLLDPKVPKTWLDRYLFHLIPVVNPDGAAHGTKLTRLGPIPEYDMVPGGMTSQDLTIAALRDEVIRLKPVMLISHHSYLLSAPFLGCFDKKTMLAALEILLEMGTQDQVYWLVRLSGPEKQTLRSYCHTTFGTKVFLTELPWYGRTPDEIRKMGAEVFMAAMRTINDGFSARAGRHDR